MNTSPPKRNVGHSLKTPSPIPPRLSVTQVADFEREGYLLPRTKVFAHEKFVGLKNYFEELLAGLPDNIPPEAMDVPHFTHPELFRWLFADEVLDLVEPIIGSDIALFSSHFICKPQGNGKRVPWHEDSAYWKGMLEPMQVVTLWLAIDPSTCSNGCMNVIPRTHTGPQKGFSDYEPVDPQKNVFPTEITPTQRKDAAAVPCELQPNEASLHDSRLIHGSPPNTSDLRRCGYTMRFMPTSVKFNQKQSGQWHQVYLARGCDGAGNQYADPSRRYPQLARYREIHAKGGALTMMTSKERMLTALKRGKPDRLPVTIHQWQKFHLRQFMNGMDQIQAFDAMGLDASVMPLDVWELAKSTAWERHTQSLGGKEPSVRSRIKTPDGELTYVLASNQYTTYATEHIIKTQQDAENFLKYWPEIHLNQVHLSQWYDRTGDRGIVRGFVGMYAQPGVWQEFCEMVGTQEAIFWAMDHPAFVHHFLEKMTQRKIDFVYRELPGAKFDLIEHGGGAASSTVISPTMFDEFCLPYDQRVIAALHEVGLLVVYHTCGGMMAILDRIPANGCDASETLSPPAMGGDICLQDQLTVKQKLGSKVALIGGIDQSNTLTNGTPKQVATQVRACFETFGKDGGYICSASDHFFHAPVANLKALADAGRECHY